MIFVQPESTGERLNVLSENGVEAVFEPRANRIEYRGYTLTAVQHAAEWRVYIFPGPQLLHTQPGHVSGLTKEDALAKARATIDHHLFR